MKYRDRFRIQSTRMRGWDYASDSVYFITICTKGRGAWFGDVVDATMDHTVLGLVAQYFWERIPHHFPHVDLDVFIVMPDHVHGALIFRSSEGVQCCPPVETRHGSGVSSAETRYTASLQNSIASLRKGNVFGPLKKGSLQSVINVYKGAVTRWAHANDIPDFRWQSRFYEHRIRSHSELQNTRLYINENPSSIFL